MEKETEIKFDNGEKYSPLVYEEYTPKKAGCLIYLLIGFIIGCIIELIVFGVEDFDFTGFIFVGLLFGSMIAAVLFGIRHMFDSQPLWQQTTIITKSCSNCHNTVGNHSTVGDICPHCGVHWTSENNNYN